MELRNKLTAFLQNIVSFFKSPSRNRTLAIVGILIVTAIIPVTVIVLQQQTNLQQHAYVPPEGTCAPQTLHTCNGLYYKTTVIAADCTTRITQALIAGKCNYHMTTCTLGYTFNSSQNRCVKTSCLNAGDKCYFGNSCGYGQHDVTDGSHSCSSTDYSNRTVCCTPKPPDPWYDCAKNVSVGGAINKHTTSGVTYSGVSCDKSQVCIDPSNGVVTPPNDSTALSVAKSKLCISMNGCTDFQLTGATTDALCQDKAKNQYRTSCKLPQYYKAQPGVPYNGVVTCHFTLGTSSTPPSNACAPRKGVCPNSSQPYCQTGYTLFAGSFPDVTCSNGSHSCCFAKTCTGSDNHCQASHSTCAPSGSQRLLDLDTTCGTGLDNEICCSGKAPTSTNYCQYATSGDGGYCGSVLGHGANTNHLYTCKSKQTTGDTSCANGCQVNSSGSDTCNTSGGGGGGGGGSCTNGKTTGFILSLKLSGIGQGNFENHSPAHTNRKALYVKVIDDTGAVKYNNTATTFSHASGRFNNPHVTLGTALVCGRSYTVNVKIPRYLSTKAMVIYGTDTTINLDPTVGDINKVDPATKEIIGDDKVDVNDYAIVRACHNVDPTTPQTFTSGSTTISLTCAELMNFFDYADGGTQGDEWAFNYNLWLRGFLKANGL